MAIGARSERSKAPGREAERRKLALIEPAALLMRMVQIEDAMSNRILHDVRADPRRLEDLLCSLGG